MNENLAQRRLVREDFDRPCQDLAVYLLGKILVRKLENGNILAGKIVETECYLGGEDKASHSYNGKLTKKNEPMYMPVGTTYVYKLYFGYHCFNISSKEPGGVVLIRALEPIAGEATMKLNRLQNIKNTARQLKSSQLCDGPSKLCIALNITSENCNKLDLTNDNGLVWIEDSSGDNLNILIINTSRIGIGTSAEEWVSKPLRYYFYGNGSVSKRDKEAEKKALLL